MIAVGGGVAAFKAVALASSLKKLNFDVYVLMTDAAQKFITPLQFQSVTGNAVVTSNWPEAVSSGKKSIFPHLYPATELDAFIVCPATADLIARLAHGHGNDLVTTTALSLPPTCLKWICPAMNCEMYANPVVKRNLKSLHKDGYSQIGPESGMLACGMEGEGRLAEVETILNEICAAFKRERTLAGKTVMVLSGPTREYIDPVRFISNASSGKMGDALVTALMDKGADILWISGTVDSVLFREFSGTKFMVESGSEMLQLALQHLEQVSAVINTAAVCDYRIKQKSTHKIKSDHAEMKLDLTRNINILHELTKHKRPHQVIYGFALESREVKKNGLAKLVSKNADAIIANTVASLNQSNGQFYFIHKNKKITEYGTVSKLECARKIIRQLSEDLQSKC